MAKETPALQHLLGIEPLDSEAITRLLDRADAHFSANRKTDKKQTSLRGRTLINCFYEASTRTRASFELAGKRLGADVVNISSSASSTTKGESLIDTAKTLNAMHPDFITLRHPCSGAAALVAPYMDCPVINAGDGAHEHPTQALTDAFTIRKKKGTLKGLRVAICGDILHSRVARSNILLLTKMGAEVRLIAPPNLMPAEAESLGATCFHRREAGLEGADIVMMLRLQRERMGGSFVASARDYFLGYGLDHAALSHAKPDALVLHPGPINRGVEICGTLADDPSFSCITDQVESGVAIRQAILEWLA